MMNTPNPRRNAFKSTHPDPRVNHLAAKLHEMHDPNRVHPDYDFDCEQLAERLVEQNVGPLGATSPKEPALPASWDSRLPVYPSSADYWFCDHILDRERGHLRRELSALSDAELKARLTSTPGLEVKIVADRVSLINWVIEKECPRAWLDRRLAALR